MIDDYFRIINISAQSSGPLVLQKVAKFNADP
jgi:hypothetical protein